MEEIKKIISLLMPHGPMDAMGVGIIDFKKKSFESFEVLNSEGELQFRPGSTIFFDLASLTKPLTNSLAYFLRPQAFTQETLLCLSHRGGLPSWGRLPSFGWKEQILSYRVHESDTLYSDFSALRVGLELEKKGVDQKKICEGIWDQDTVYWTDLSPLAQTVQYGFIAQEPNFGKVHDPNAYVIGSFCAHAGVFSTVDGLCRTLLNYQAGTDFILQVKADLGKHPHRFSFGWDRVTDPKNTLAGVGCGPHTFGHLGFTGTSIWIDPDAQKGHVIVSNAVKQSWYDKDLLNDIRRMVGKIVWEK